MHMREDRMGEACAAWAALEAVRRCFSGLAVDPEGSAGIATSAAQQSRHICKEKAVCFRSRNAVNAGALAQAGFTRQWRGWRLSAYNIVSSADMQAILGRGNETWTVAVNGLGDVGPVLSRMCPSYSRARSWCSGR